MYVKKIPQDTETTCKELRHVNRTEKPMVETKVEKLSAFKASNRHVKSELNKALPRGSRTIRRRTIRRGQFVADNSSQSKILIS